MKSEILALHEVSLKRDGHFILKNIDLSVKKGTVHSILGANGAGKTSLAYLIMGCENYQPDEGRIMFNHQDITHFPIWKRAQLGLTLAWQEPARFEGLSVEDYIAVGMKNKNRDEIRKALETVLLAPEKYMMREVGKYLSGGERKRIELAAVFAMKPGMVIMDEPDSGIDILAMEYVLKMIDRLKRQGATVLLITHREDVSQFVDRASLMCSGIIVKEGDPKEIADYYKNKCIPCPDKIFPSDANNKSQEKAGG